MTPRQKVAALLLLLVARIVADDEQFTSEIEAIATKLEVVA